jgi:putative DNA primase/helicase
VLGDYGTEINPDTLLARKGDPVVRNDLARLVGMRYVMAVEPPKDKSWDISTIKAMTGGDPIVARYLVPRAVQLQAAVRSASRC